MPRMLDGKVVLITGAAGGIGRATALLCAEEGAKVVVSDVKAEGIEETTSLVARAGGEVVSAVADITKSMEVSSMVHKAVEAFGRLDCAFNNAGITGGQIGQGGKYTGDWDEEAFDRIVGVNLKGTWLCMKAEILQMVAQGGHGCIVNTASLAGICGFLTTTGYSASKHGIIGLTKTAALEYAPDIRVNALCPGYVDTQMLADTMSRRGEQVLKQIPFKRLARAQEMAGMVCWLLSDRASYASGQAFTVDGAYMAGRPA